MTKYNFRRIISSTKVKNGNWYLNAYEASLHHGANKSLYEITLRCRDSNEEIPIKKGFIVGPVEEKLKAYVEKYARWAKETIGSFG